MREGVQFVSGIYRLEDASPTPVLVVCTTINRILHEAAHRSHLISPIIDS